MVELVSGVFVIVAVIGIITLAILGKSIPDVLSAIAFAGITFYVGARNFNAGVFTGQKNGSGDSKG